MELKVMKTIQVALEKELLQAADRAARKAKQNRSALIREALREYLRRLQVRAEEQREIEAYRKHPQAPEELDDIELWAKGATWPKR